MIQAALRAISGWFHQHSVPVPGLSVQSCVVTVTVQVVGHVSNCRRDEHVTPCVLRHIQLAEWIESVQAGSFHTLWRHLGCDRPTQGLQLLLSPAQYTCLAPLLLTWAWYWQVAQVGAIRVLQCQGSR